MEEGERGREKEGREQRESKKNEKERWTYQLSARVDVQLAMSGAAEHYLMQGCEVKSRRNCWIWNVQRYVKLKHISLWLTSQTNGSMFLYLLGHDCQNMRYSCKIYSNRNLFIVCSRCHVPENLPTSASGKPSTWFPLERPVQKSLCLLKLSF